MVGVEECHHPLDVIGDDPHPSTVSLWDSTYETGDGSELTAEHLMNGEHVAAVGHGWGSPLGRKGAIATAEKRGTNAGKEGHVSHVTQRDPY